MHGNIPPSPRDRSPPVGLLLMYALTVVWIAFLAWAVLRFAHVLYRAIA